MISQQPEIAQQAVLITVLILAVTGMGIYRMKPVTVLFSTALFCSLAGYVSVEKWMSFAGNSNIIVILLLMMITPGLLSQKDLLKWRHKFLNTALSKVKLNLAIFIYPLSAILSNTAVTGIFLSLLSKSKHASHTLLLPVSYFSIVAGTSTLIGTSTHLIASAWLLEQTGTGLDFFVFTPMSLLLMVGCAPVIIYFSNKVLPLSAMGEDHTANSYWLMEVRVKADSKWAEKSVADAGLRNLETLYLSQVDRRGNLLLNISPNFLIQSGDRLQFIGSLEQFSAHHGVKALEGINADVKKVSNKVSQVVLTKHSPLIGKMLVDLDFRNTMDAVVLGINRGKEKFSERIARIPLEAGDVLALITGPSFAAKLKQQSAWFYVIDEVQDMQMSQISNRNIGLIAFLACIGLTALEVLSIATAFISLTAIFFLLRIINFNEMINRFRLDLFISLVSSLAIAHAVLNSGLADSFAFYANQMLSLVDGEMVNHVGMLIILIYGMILTNLVTNVATVSLTLPFAISLAQVLNIDPNAYIMAAVFASSCAFLTPFGYQTHLMVMTAGEYQLKHFLKIGIPLTVVYLILCLIALPALFPFD